jgi:putative transcriptional regulator
MTLTQRDRKSHKCEAALDHSCDAPHPCRMKQTASFLDGKLLVAMPGMGDTRFERAVIFICAHSDDGAMGLIINKPAPDLRFADLLEQLEIDADAEQSAIRVHFGGPVEHGRGFVLHSADYEANGATMSVTEEFGMTATIDILRDIAVGRGPARSLLALGYAGWGPGQLENEIAMNGWLTTEADQELVFTTKDDAKWAAALKSLGVDPLSLSASAGHA